MPEPWITEPKQVGLASIHSVLQWIPFVHEA